VSIEESSQFASALLLCAKTGGWKVEVTGESAEESPYVAMTSKLIAAFPKFGNFQIEPDTSSGSYFLGANIVAPKRRIYPKYEEAERRKREPTEAYQLSNIGVANWPGSRWQMDQAFIELLTPLNTISRRTDLGDSIMTAIVLAPLNPQAIKFTELGRLRVQECERVAALRTELTKCGAEVLEQGDTLT